MIIYKHDEFTLELNENEYKICKTCSSGEVPILITKDKVQAELMLEYIKTK